MNNFQKILKGKWHVIFVLVGFFLIIVLCTTMLLDINSSEKIKVENVEKLIDDIGYISENSGNRIDSANDAYEKLDSNLRWHVSNRDELRKAKDEYNEIMAEKVTNMIKDIPNEISLTDHSLIEDAWLQYVALDKDQKGLVKGNKKLEKAYQEINSLLVESVIKKIDAIGAVSLDTEKEFKEIDSLYNKIETHHKELVLNYDIYLEKKKEYSGLRVQQCINEINALGDITLESENAIKDVKELYGRLNSEEKTRVNNYNLLEQKENELLVMKKKAEELSKTIKSGDVISDDKWQFSYKKTRISASIYPNNTSGYYTYYTSDDDQVFVDMIFSLKNVSVDSLSMQNAVESVEVVYDEQYKYSNFSLFYSNGDDIDKVYSWDGMEALKTTTLHIVVAIPREAKNNNKSLVISLVIAGEEKIIRVR